MRHFYEADAAGKSQKESKSPFVSENLLNVLKMCAAAWLHMFYSDKDAFWLVFGQLSGLGFAGIRG